MTQVRASRAGAGNRGPGPVRPGLPGPLRALLDASSLAVVAADATGAVTYANPGAATLFDHPTEALVGQPVELLVPEAATASHQGLRTQFPGSPDARPAVGGLVRRARRRDGTELPVEISLTPLDLGGGCRWVVVAVTDVSARLAAERQAAELGRAYLTLARLNEAVIRSATAPDLYDSTCRIAVGQGGYVGAWVAVLAVDGAVEVAAAAGGLAPHLTRLRVSLDAGSTRGTGPTAVALREERPCYVADLQHDPATATWHEAARQYGVASGASFPLRTRGRVVGALTLYSDQVGAFEDGVGELFAGVADNVSHALDGFAARADLEREASARRDLLRRLVTAEETERARIAAGVHDDSVQLLAAVDLRLGLLLRRLGDAPETADLVATARAVLDTVHLAADSLRHLLFELEPSSATQCWSDAVRTTAEHVFEDQPTTWTLLSGDEVELTGTERSQALRIVKEALINVRKHAGATHVDIGVRSTRAGVEVSVTDDGVGLPPGVDPEQLPPRRGHRGLATMRDRATASGGWCRLERAGTGGTTLRFFVPDGRRG